MSACRGSIAGHRHRRESDENVKNDQLRAENGRGGPRRLLRSSRPHEIFQPPQQGFYSVHAQLQLLGKIFLLFTPPPHLISTHLTLAFINNIILHLLLVLCTAVNVRIKN
jgi:hypothetical protein